MRRRGRREKMGCFELAVVAVAIFVALQVGAIGIKIVTELAILAATLMKWMAVGLVGAVGVALVGAAIFGLARGLKGIAKGLWHVGKPKPLVYVPRPEESCHRQARRWEKSIKTTVGRLRRRGWLPKSDAKRYLNIARSAVARVKALESDMAMMRDLPSTDKWTTHLGKAAKTIVERLERTYLALVQLLAESAVQPDQGVAGDLREVTDELESLVSALDDVRKAGPASTARVTAEYLSATGSNGATDRIEEAQADRVQT